MYMKNKFAIYMIIKDEFNIVELINYYSIIGFNYFIILDDNSRIDYDLLFENNNIDKNMYCLYKTDNLITNYNYFVHEAKSSLFVKNVLYKILIDNKIDYIMQIDADEFLFINNGNNINDIINEYLPFDSLRINWLLFGSNNLYKNNSNSIIKTFNKCNNELNSYCKSITKVSSIDVDFLLKGNISPHYLPIYNNCIAKNILNEIIDKNTSIIKIDHPYDKVNLYIAHYVVQDFQTFIRRKILRLDEFKNEIKDIEYTKKYLYDNIDNFTYFMHLLYLNKDVNEEYYQQFKIIPDKFIKYLLIFFNNHDTCDKINNNIINKMYYNIV